MPKVTHYKWYLYPTILLFVALTFSVTALLFYQWILAVVGYVVILLLGVLYYYIQSNYRKELGQYISTLSHRVNRAGEEAVTNLPVGIILYDQNYNIQWVNPYIHDLLPEEYLGQPLSIISSELPILLEDKNQEHRLKLGDLEHYVYERPNERLLYFFDMTETVETKERYNEEKTVIGIIFLDNYDEVTQSLEDQVTSSLRNKVVGLLNQWANEHDILLRSTDDDRFVAVFNQRALSEIETNQFQIIDQIREETSKDQVSLTLSIGIGTGERTMRELGSLAQSSLDLALGRGGDQVAIKEKSGQVRFYGGKTNAVEKRTRVRARVISHALRDFVRESNQVIVMGHKTPDMDAIGASIGVLKVAEVNDKDAYIVVDNENVSPDVQKLMDEVENHEYLWSRFISPAEALEQLTKQTLLVVVDTHKPSLVIEPKLLERVHRVVVLDHHRRGEEFIENPALVYMEPYASSASELVTELLEYQPNKVKMDALEATAMLAGMMVDTKHFSIRTGSRTFEAASYLKANGADTTAVQLLLKEDLENYNERSKLISRSVIYGNGMAIARGEEGQSYHQVLIAQAADTLLTMNDVRASFVISYRSDGRLSVSARSLGDVNVQVIMEKLGGGGHLTNAATQMDDTTLLEAESMLKEAIDQYLGGTSK
ncbi:DHH family phosphoesterase [Geomicrobium sp. JCM 19039]|uniref:DHH family phosphoesterase n=1 Tax=Geomicrobium sp. JCM 19039 TaxID=1460636 RepID=UPI00045F114E|nr:DHH family phosphoesterase [Geomicrobium sp. JCM 19039]GAK12016.1 phosphoesterase, DHH family protein [Geomicrobium sp. JCM 19039]